MVSFYLLLFAQEIVFAQVCLSAQGVQWIEDGPALASCGTAQSNYYVWVHFERVSSNYVRTVQVSNLPTGWTYLGQSDVINSQYTFGPNTYNSTKYKLSFSVPANSPNGTLQVREKLHCTPENTNSYSTYRNIEVNRPSTLPSISGSNIICTNNTYTVSHPAIGSGTYTWSIGSNISINSGQGTNSVNIQATGNGSSWVKATLSTDACGNTNLASATKNIGVGSAVISSTGQYRFDTYVEHLYLNVPSGQVASYNWAVISEDPTLNQNYGQAVYATSFTGGTVSATPSNDCGTGSTVYFTVPAYGSFLMAYPNPVKDILTLELKNVESKESLPESVDLYSESSTKKVKSVSIQDVSKNKAFKDGNKIELGVEDLPRGIYYLHINPNDKQKQEVKKVRIRLN